MSLVLLMATPKLVDDGTAELEKELYHPEHNMMCTA
jgi:hypothetical protein